MSLFCSCDILWYRSVVVYCFVMLTFGFVVVLVFCRFVAVLCYMFGLLFDCLNVCLFVVLLCCCCVVVMLWCGRGVLWIVFLCGFGVLLCCCVVVMRLFRCCFVVVGLLKCYFCVVVLLLCCWFVVVLFLVVLL